MMCYDEPQLIKMFELVKTFVWCAGGDGDGYIVSDENYKNYAELFAIWNKKQPYPYNERYDGDNFITFSDGQENIIFIKYRTDVENAWQPDIIVEIH